MVPLSHWLSATIKIKEIAEITQKKFTWSKWKITVLRKLDWGTIEANSPVSAIVGCTRASRFLLPHNFVQTFCVVPYIIIFDGMLHFLGLETGQSYPPEEGWGELTCRLRSKHMTWSKSLTAAAHLIVCWGPESPWLCRDDRTSTSLLLPGLNIGCHCQAHHQGKDQAHSDPTPGR